MNIRQLNKTVLFQQASTDITISSSAASWFLVWIVVLSNWDEYVINRIYIYMIWSMVILQYRKYRQYRNHWRPTFYSYNLYYWYPDLCVFWIRAGQYAHDFFFRIAATTTGPLRGWNASDSMCFRWGHFDHLCLKLADLILNLHHCILLSYVCFRFAATTKGSLRGWNASNAMCFGWGHLGHICLIWAHETFPMHRWTWRQSGMWAGRFR